MWRRVFFFLFAFPSQWARASHSLATLSDRLFVVSEKGEFLSPKSDNWFKHFRRLIYLFGCVDVRRIFVSWLDADATTKFEQLLLTFHSFQFLMFRRFSIWFDVSNVISGKRGKLHFPASMWRRFDKNFGFIREQRMASSSPTSFSCGMKTFRLMTDINLHNQRVISRVAGETAVGKLMLDASKWFNGVIWSSHSRWAWNGLNDHPDVFCWFFWVI